jgi:anti-sigma factor RsiW
MESCQYGRQLSAYHDGELPPVERQAVEEHLRQCSSCEQELARIRALSRFISAARMPAGGVWGAPAMPPHVLERLHRNVIELRERVIVGMARVLTAAAAVILVVATCWLWQTAGAQGSEAAPIEAWEETAVTLRSEAPAPEARMAQWISDGLSAENGHE